MNLYDAVQNGNLERVTLLVEQGVEKDQTFGDRKDTALCVAADNGDIDIIRYLVEHGADVAKADKYGWYPLINAAFHGHLDVVRYLLEQGADREKVNLWGCTPLHYTASQGHLEVAKLLMVYGADLNARDIRGQLPIDMRQNNTEEIKQAIRDEPRRRMDHGHKRATEQDRHPNAATSASALQEDEQEEQSNKRPRLNEGVEAEEGKVAEEDEDSDPSDEEYD